MALEFDPATGKISYRGREIGEQVVKDGRYALRLNFEYETSGDDWLVPLSWLAVGLSRLPENQLPTPLLSIETPEDSIEKVFEAPRLLIEKLVPRKNYVWAFHKADADPWPSRLHGHEYDKGLKLDAITGEIFDVATRQLCKTLKRKHLWSIQSELRASKDFNELVVELVDVPSDDS